MGEFGKYISDKRKEKGISLRTMAKDLNISVSYLSDLEQGNKMPPNSSNDKYKDLIINIMNYLDMNDMDKQECLKFADSDLIKKGHISNDITSYMEQTPLAGIALRKAKDLNYSNDDWEKIIDELTKTRKE